MFRLWAKFVLAISQRGRKNGRTTASRRRYQPRLDLLEDRRLLSAVALDPTFGAQGVTAPDANALARSTVVAGDGNILVLDQTQAGPEKFGSEAEFRQYLIDQAVQNYSGEFGRSFSYYSSYNYSRTTITPFLVNQTATPASVTTNGDPSFSTTNTQVQGVDEGDSVKTDGHYLYILSGNQLVILNAWPATALASLSETHLTGTPLAEYLDGNRLTVITQDYPQGVSPSDGGMIMNPLYRIASQSPIYGQPYVGPHSFVKVTVFDVSDRTAPTVVQETNLDGTYNNSRAIGTTVYVALNNSISALPGPTYTVDGDFYVYETEAAYRARLEAVPLDTLLPLYTTHSSDADGPHDRTGLLTALTDIYRPVLPADNNLLSVVAFDVGGTVAGPTHSVSLLTASGATLYAAPDNFYLMTSRWSSDSPWTAIDKLSLKDGDITLTATGGVPGTILNQFSVGENGAYFYIATTTTSGWNNTSNNVYVLTEYSHGLVVTGKVENMAPGEKIYSVRFLGDRAFVSTFVQFDPLFALDLSDPTAPVLDGQLEVSGYTGYLQAIDATHLIGIGRDVVANEPGDFEISLFDVSDLHHPTLASRYRVTLDGWWAWSVGANYDYHAITYYPEYQTLALPVSGILATAGLGFSSRQTTQADLLVFHVDGASGTLDLRGQISDGSLIQRSVFIGNMVYSLSNTSVQVHSLDDLTTLVGQVPLHGLSVPVLTAPGTPFIGNVGLGNVVLGRPIFVHGGPVQLTHLDGQSLTFDATPNVTLADKFYAKTLDRKAGAGEAALWAGVLKAGVSADQVAKGFVESTEFLSNLVADYYTNYLGRAASPAEIDLWKAALQSGMTFEQMSVGFLNSAEFFAHQGGTSVDFVQGLYGNLLGRAANATEVADWMRALAQGLTPQQVIGDFLSGLEYCGRAVHQLYQHYLGRAADSGAEGWVSQLLAAEAKNAGTGQFADGALKQLAIGLLSSAEFTTGLKDLTVSGGAVV